MAKTNTNNFFVIFLKFNSFLCRKPTTGSFQNTQIKKWASINFLLGKEAPEIAQHSNKKKPTDKPRAFSLSS
jgi:hypothetical protein